LKVNRGAVDGGQTIGSREELDRNTLNAVIETINTIYWKFGPVQTVTHFVRSPGETAPTPSVFVPVRSRAGRPKTEYRLRLRAPAEVALARRANVPVYLLTETVVQALGYPLNMPPTLLVARSIEAALDTSYRTVRLLSDEAVRDPRLEDIAVAMLSIDAVGARVILEANRDEVSAAYLLRRVVEERLLALATSVRFQDLNPAIPKVGTSVSEAFLRRKIRLSRHISKLQ